MPSAANAIYWPEIYTNQSIVVENAKDPYNDTPSPKCFGTVSPLDPEMFAGIDEYVDHMASAKYSPLEVAGWLEDLAAVESTQKLFAGFKPANRRRGIKPSSRSMRRFRMASGASSPRRCARAFYSSDLPSGTGRLPPRRTRKREPGCLIIVPRAPGGGGVHVCDTHTHRPGVRLIRRKRGVYRDDPHLWLCALSGAAGWADQVKAAAIDRDIRGDGKRWQFSGNAHKASPGYCCTGAMNDRAAALPPALSCSIRFGDAFQARRGCSTLIEQSGIVI